MFSEVYAPTLSLHPSAAKNLQAYDFTYNELMQLGKPLLKDMEIHPSS